MNCPSCNRILASTLSVCPSCGTMVHDSVREELALKISPVVKKDQHVIIETSAAVPLPPSPVVQKIQETTPIMNKATSPTLVEFQNKNATLPDWRLQLQNSVRKRLDNKNNDVAVIEPKPRRAAMVTNGATALKVEAEEKPQAAANPQLAKALRRIEESRQKYLVSEEPTPVTIPYQQNSVKQFPVMMQNYSNDFAPRQEVANNISSFAKPNIFQFSSETKIEQKAEKFDTNKLPPLPPPAKISSSFEKRPVEAKKLEPIDDYALEDYELIEATESEVVAYSEPEGLEEIEESEENDDFAPVSLRFNAALFDLLICSFLSLILLSPFMLLNGKFFSFEGFFAFLATCSIVMFIYLTSTIAFLGRSFGMRLFSLEIIDVEENAYPSLHQAAVSSSVYLLSLGLGGIGFLPMLMNSEKRAAHDLLSGTIVVKEY